MRTINIVGSVNYSVYLNGISAKWCRYYCHFGVGVIIRCCSTFQVDLCEPILRSHESGRHWSLHHNGLIGTQMVLYSFATKVEFSSDLKLRNKFKLFPHQHLNFQIMFSHSFSNQNVLWVTEPP